MKAAIYALVFGLLAMGTAALAAQGAGVTSLQPVWMFSGALGGAILGAVLGGIRDIIAAIEKTKTDQP
jgi:hypothetical protein